MHFSTTLATLLSTIPLLHLASAACYSGGAPWPSDHAAALLAIQSAAYQMELNSPLSPGEHVYNKKVGDKCLHFVLDNISGYYRSIEASEALDGWGKEYRGCDNGGDTSYTNWRYVMDTNEDVNACKNT